MTEVREEPSPNRSVRARRSAEHQVAEPADQPRSQETTGAIRRVGVAMIFAFAAILVFNSAGTRSWVRDLPASPLSDRLIVVADGWHAAMDGLGLAAPAAFLRNRMYDIRDVAWTDLFGGGTAIAGGDEDASEGADARPVTAEERLSETPRGG